MARALMFYALRERNGARDAHSAGTLIDAPGGRGRCQPGTVAHRGDRAPGRAPRMGALPGRLAAARAGAGAGRHSEPLLADQELRGPPRYWEGAVEVRGHARRTCASAAAATSNWSATAQER